jgi:DNA modification methylase
MSKIELIHGDCLIEMKKIPTESVDLIWTSPPYNKTGFRGRPDLSKVKGRWQNSNIQYCDFKDDLDEQEYKEIQKNLINECFRIIKKTGSILYNHKIRRANRKASSPMEWILKSEAIFYQEIIWNRLSCCDHNINYLDPITERIYWLIKDTPKCFKNPKYATEIWNIPPLPETRHPAPFPLKLSQLAIQLTTEKGDVVLDPYLGSGTSGVVAKELGRNFIGIEIEKKYFDIAKRRIDNTPEPLFV